MTRLRSLLSHGIFRPFLDACLARLASSPLTPCILSVRILFPGRVQVGARARRVALAPWRLALSMLHHPCLASPGKAPLLW